MRYSLARREPTWSTLPLWKDFDTLFGGMTNGFNEESTQWLEKNMKTEIEETDKAYKVSFEVPGLTDKDLRVEVKDHVLRVSGERKSKTEKKEGQFFRTERHYGSLERSFTLPSDVDTERIEARAENGVLNVTLPKTERSAGRTIQIK